MWESQIAQNMVPILVMNKILNLLVQNKRFINKRNFSFHLFFLNVFFERLLCNYFK